MTMGFHKGQPSGPGAQGCAHSSGKELAAAPGTPGQGHRDAPCPLRSPEMGGIAAWGLHVPSAPSAWATAVHRGPQHVPSTSLQPV